MYIEKLFQNIAEVFVMDIMHNVWQEMDKHSKICNNVVITLSCNVPLSLKHWNVIPVSF